MPSAATVTLANATGDYVRITGTQTIASFGVALAGTVRTVEFTGAAKITYNSTSMVLPAAQNINCAPNDVGIFRSRGGSNWICVNYSPASGVPPVQLTAADVGLGNVENVALSTWAGSSNLVTLGTVTAGTWQGSSIAPNKGGTGLIAVSQGDLLYGSGSNAYSRLSKNTTTSRYLSNTGANNDPTWAQVSLNSGVTGVLPPVNGGVGAAVQDAGAPTGVLQTIDLALGNTIKLDLGSATGNVTLTLQNPTPGLLCFIILKQGATMRNLIFPTGTRGPLLWGISWSGTGANKTDLLTFFYDGTNYLVVGQAPDIG